MNAFASKGRSARVMFKTSTGLTGTVTVMDAVITVAHWLKSYGDVVAVEDVSLVAWCGEVEGRRLTADNATLGDAR